MQTKIAFPSPVRARRAGLGFGAEVAQHDQRLNVTGVLEGDDGFGRAFRAKDFVFGQFVETDEFGAIERQPVHLALALHRDQAVGAPVLDRAASARFEGQFLGGEKLFAVLSHQQHAGLGFPGGANQFLEGSVLE
jgi:hypothetical protein